MSPATGNQSKILPVKSDRDRAASHVVQEALLAASICRISVLIKQDKE